ncbi:MAG: DNA polymerase III subunit delta [Dehalococcoidales bacterium]|nr:DNA polymerase III subunit delta [Dehalococcoidales bacterium]
MHVLVGEDDYSIHEAIEEIKRGIGDPSGLLSNSTTLDGRTVTAEELQGACSTVPFLAEKRLVVVEGLLARYEEPSSERRKVREKEPSDIKKVVAAIRALPPFTELVLVDGAVKDGNPLLRELSTIVKVRTFPLLNTTQLAQWVEGRVRQAGASISAQAVGSLVRLIGNDLWAMASEVDKLILYRGGRRIEDADVKLLVSHAREESVFALVDAVLESRLTAAQEMLRRLFQQGVSASQLLAMLARQVRIIFLTKEMLARGYPHLEIQTRLGLAQGFLVRKAVEQAGRYSQMRLRELFHRLLDIDMAMKTGRLEGELAMEILVTELAGDAKAY